MKQELLKLVEAPGPYTQHQHVAKLRYVAQSHVLRSRWARDVRSKSMLNLELVTREGARISALS